MDENFKKIRIGKYDALLYVNNDGSYTIAYAHEGGSIIFGKDLKELKKKFLLSMKLCEEIKFCLEREMLLNKN